MADCRFVSNGWSNGSPSTSIAEELYESFIQLVVTANFPEFIVHLFQYEKQPGTIAANFLKVFRK
jgi:hypothetical protein